MTKAGKLFLLPNLLGEGTVEDVIPEGVKKAVLTSVGTKTGGNGRGGFLQDTIVK